MMLQTLFEDYYMGRRKGKALGVFLSVVAAFSLVGLVSNVNAQEAVIKTEPQQTTWIADGMTVYRMIVSADNTGLGGAEI